MVDAMRMQRTVGRDLALPATAIADGWALEGSLA
jgi:hypothetical protein